MFEPMKPAPPVTTVILQRYSEFAGAPIAARCEGTSGGAGPASRHLRCLEPAALGELRAAGRPAPQRVAARDEGAVREILQRARLREQEPLPGHTAECQEGPDLRLELDALGHGLEPERLAECDDRARQLRSIVGVGEAAHERAVDLQYVDGEAVQVGE